MGQKGDRTYVGVTVDGLGDGGEDDVGYMGDVDVAEGPDRLVDYDGDGVFVGLHRLAISLSFESRGK